MGIVRKIISGGQTGVDRAAWDEAIARGIPHGGAVPRGRRAEDGPLPACYRATELPEDDYAARTEANVRAADATLIMARGPLTGGTALTRKLAEQYAKPMLCVDLTREPQAAEKIRRWLQHERPTVLNVAGPRESTAPGIYQEARALLRQVFAGEEESGGAEG